MPMRILVTGGAGYIGSTLVQVLLDQGHQVRVLDSLLHGGESLLGVWTHPRFSFQRGDIRDSAAVAVALSDMDAVVHLAAIVGDPACAQQPEQAEAVNLNASRQLLQQAQAMGISRFVSASTCSNYGKMADPDAMVDEDSELSPVSLYARTKVAFEQEVLAIPRHGSFCATSLRFATVFGVSPRMRFDLTVNEFTMEMLTKQHILVFGEQFWRPYVHVFDVARAVVTVLTAPAAIVASEVFNVGCTTENYQKQQLIELIKPHAPAATIEYVHKTEDPRDYRVKFERITAALGYRITRTVPDGIAEIAALVKAGIIHNYDAACYRNSN